MTFDRIRRADPKAVLLARDALAASQWEAALADAGPVDSRSVWSSRALFGGTRWLVDAWESARISTTARRGDERCLLSGTQTDALWQRVIDASPERSLLISTEGVATWTRLARGTLFEHGIDPGSLKAASWPGESGVWLDWNRRFDTELRQRGWIDPESLLYCFNRADVTPDRPELLILDPPELTPEWRGLQDRWGDAGARVETLYPSGCRATTRALLATDPESELALVAGWAAALLEQEPLARLAVVVPDLAERRDPVERVFRDRVGSVNLSSLAGRCVADIGIFGAALAALELLASGGDFRAVSRWLRSPFFPPELRDGQDLRASTERQLREDSRVQQPFLESFHRRGLRDRLRQSIPDSVARLDLALRTLPRFATPTGWAETLQSCLKTLGWSGFEAEIPERLREAWDEVWKQFSTLTPVLGSLDANGALRELERVARRIELQPRLGLHGVHLLRRVAEIGPGYRASWVLGFSDVHWPEPARPNPLIPWSVQAAHGMAAARPDAALQASRAEFDRLLQRVPEAVFSCPQRSGDQPQSPNPRLEHWQRESAEAHIVSSPMSAASQRIGARAWQILADPAPAFGPRKIPGGAATLDLQSACPVEAFCVRRLHAEPLELPVRGIDPRLRGMLMHRTLELLTDAEIDRSNPDALTACIERAFAERLVPGDERWQSLVAAEMQRTGDLITKFLTLDASRAPFVTLAVERRVELEIGGRLLTGRIDRIDRLASGGRLLIDYKTGKAATSGWFQERLSNCQLPLYAQHEEEAVTGIALVTLGSDQIAYRAAGMEVADLPGRQQSFEPAAWAAQLAAWRAKLELLVEEFARGDVRLRPGSTSPADDAFAVLTRAREADE